MFLALFLYFFLLSVLVVWSSRQVTTSQGFIIGDRSLNFWLTAMAAHASDMSQWLFMGYPALVFIGGLFNVWVAVGLTLCMWLNWELVARRFRILTEKWNCSTFSSFLHQRYQSEFLQLLSALFCFVFYVVYICSGLMGLGLLGQTLFDVSYYSSISIGTSLIIGYVVVGGFITLAWMDLVQGIFLLLVICLVPFIAVEKLGGWENMHAYLSTKADFLKVLPHNFLEWVSLISLIFGWGLGYFGQPHIITKFMGIKNPEEIAKSRNVGMTWMILSLAAATLVGLVGAGFFKDGLADPQLVFVGMVKETFSPFFMGLILCAILAATINVMSSQLLILSSILSEDFYKRFFNKECSSERLLWISRFFVVVAAVVAFSIAFVKMSSIYHLVHYAWSGLGAAFGPLILVSLYSERANKQGAIAGILTGGAVAALWPLVDPYLPLHIDSLIPAFILSTSNIFLISHLSHKMVAERKLDSQS